MSKEEISILDFLGKLAALTVSASVVASLAYDWGFFYTIGISFNELPTSLSDHARTALDWAPTFAGGAFCYLIGELFTRRVEHGKTESEILATSSNPSRLKKFRDSPWSLAWLFVIGCPITYGLFGDAQLDGLKIAVMLAWAMFCLWVFTYPTIKERWPNPIKFAVLFVPAICIYFWITGRVDAIKLYEDQPSTLVTYTKDSDKPAHVTVLRYFDKAVLLKDENGALSFHEWSAIDSIKPDATFKRFHGLLCHWSENTCASGISSPSPTKDAHGESATSAQTASTRSRGR